MYFRIFFTNTKLSFLDIQTSQDRNQFITPVYCKPTFRWAFSHFDSFISRCYKFGLASTLIFRSYSICCSMEIFHNEIIKLKEIFGKHGYDNKFLSSASKPFFKAKLVVKEFRNIQILKNIFIFSSLI